MTTIRRITLPKRSSPIRLLIVALQFCAISAIYAASAEKAVFDVPAGKAVQTLKEFAKEAKREIMFPIESVGEVTTKAVKGSFTIREGLDRLLSDTSLRAFEDEKTGAIIVTSADDSKYPRADSNEDFKVAQPGTIQAVKAPAPGIPIAEEEPIQLAPVTVGATLRTEPLLSVPISVAVMDGNHMYQMGLSNLADVAPEIPSMTFRTGASNKDTSILIRGVGTITTSLGAEPDVSTVVDGVVLAMPGQATMALMDVDHIEILRGPQGTLFGKNSSVGVVNVVTKEPSEQTHGYFDTAYFGDHNEEAFHAGVSGAVVPNFIRAAVSFLYVNYDGNEKNIFLNQTVNGYQNFGVRTKFVISRSADFKATVIASFVKSSTTIPNVGPIIATSNIAFPSGVITNSATAPAAILPIVASPNNLNINSGLLGRTNDINNGCSAELNWFLHNDYEVTSITAYQHWYNNQLPDQGIVPQPTVGQTLSWDDAHLWLDEYSQELRLTSPNGRFLTFVSGLFYERTIAMQTYHRAIVQQPTAGNLVPNYTDAHWGTLFNNYSVYGEATLNFTSAFRAIAGLRLTKDTLSFYHQRISSSATAVPGISPTIGIHSGDTSANGVSGRIGPQYDITKNITVYATYSKGYKGPAYNMFLNQLATQTAPLLPETSDDYEIGLKSLTFHNRLQFTATAFDTIYHDYQANFYMQVAGVNVVNLINAGQVSTKGVEADLNAIVTRQLTLSASVSRANAVVDHFNTPPGAINIDGQPLPFAPRLRTNAAARYKVPAFAGLNLEFTTNYMWQSKEQFNLQETPDTVQKQYGIWNASIALSKPEQGWRLSFVVKNILNQHYATNISQVAGCDWRIVARDNNRYVGVNFHKDY